jgi:putative redox protein
VRSATARRRAGYTHDVEVDTGHTVVIDEPAADGGNDEGPSATRMLVASLAACTAITIEMYADRKGWDVGDLEVEVKAELSDSSGNPSKFDILIKLPEALDDEQERRLLIVAAKCPVHRALANNAHFVDHAIRV